MRRSAAVSTWSEAEEAAQEALASGSTALGAALTGFFVAAGQHPGVLFSPVSLLVGGLGAGVFAYDGRHRQPGRDAKRPRGFQQGEAIPHAARVAVPGCVFALPVACAFHPGTTILSCARPGVAAAKEAGSKERAALIELVASRGATALSDPKLKKALISQFGVVEEGLVTPGDLVAPEGLQHQATEQSGGWGAPWSGESTDHSDSEHAVVAADAQGLFVALSFGNMASGPLLEGFDVNVPTSAQPVMRGVTRLSPGAALPSGNGLRILKESGRAVTGARAQVGQRTWSVTRAPGTKDVSVAAALPLEPQ